MADLTPDDWTRINKLLAMMAHNPAWRGGTRMADAPARIWIDPTGVTMGATDQPHEVTPHDVEYIRADLARDAMRAEREACAVEADKIALAAKIALGDLRQDEAHAIVATRVLASQFAKHAAALRARGQGGE